jgi:hypothetical protein
MMEARLLYIAPSIWFETTQTEQAEVSYFDDSVRRLVVPTDKTDPVFRDAQESINECTKDAQERTPLKRRQSGTKGDIVK